MTADQKLSEVLSEEMGIKTLQTFLVGGDEWQGVQHMQATTMNNLKEMIHDVCLDIPEEIVKKAFFSIKTRANCCWKQGVWKEKEQV